MRIYYVLDEGLPCNCQTGVGLDTVASLQNAIKCLVKSKEVMAVQTHEIEVYPIGTTKYNFHQRTPLKPDDKLPKGSTSKDYIFCHAPHEVQDLSAEQRRLYSNPQGVVAAPAPPPMARPPATQLKMDSPKKKAEEARRKKEKAEAVAAKKRAEEEKEARRRAEEERLAAEKAKREAEEEEARRLELERIAKELEEQKLLEEEAAAAEQARLEQEQRELEEQRRLEEEEASKRAEEEARLAAEEEAKRLEAERIAREQEEEAKRLEQERLEQEQRAREEAERKAREEAKRMAAEKAAAEEEERRRQAEKEEEKAKKKKKDKDADDSDWDIPDREKKNYHIDFNPKPLDLTRFKIWFMVGDQVPFEMICPISMDVKGLKVEILKLTSESKFVKEYFDGLKDPNEILVYPAGSWGEGQPLPGDILVPRNSSENAFFSVLRPEDNRKGLTLMEDSDRLDQSFASLDVSKKRDKQKKKKNKKKDKDSDSGVEGWPREKIKYDFTPTPMDMSTFKCFYQLGDTVPYYIRINGWEKVGVLKERILETRGTRHCPYLDGVTDASVLKVFPPGADPEIGRDLEPDDTIPNNSSFEDPLIVIK